MLNTSFPRFKGDIGNEETFDFPIYRYTVQEANSMNVVVNQDEKLAFSFIRAAQLLERKGIKAITTSCGFLAVYQDVIARSVRIPVAMSSLVMLPAISKMTGGKKIGILTAKKTSLGKSHFKACNAEEIPVAVEGMEGTDFYRMYVEGEMVKDVSVMKQELLSKAIKLMESNPDIGSFLLECTNMPPFSDKLKGLGLPVFDIRNLVEMLYRFVS